MEQTFMGYRRADGRVGVRNYLAVIPSVFCANRTAERIAAQVPGAVALRHAVGCSQVGVDLEMAGITLKAMATHPNVGAVLVVGLGCERIEPHELVDAAKEAGVPVRCVIIQDAGTEKTIEKGVEYAKELMEIINQQQRVPCPVSELMLATKCGGTDATSGLAANPAVGYAADRIVEAGGCAILSELSELLGTEHILAKRAVNQEVADKIYNAVYEIEDVMKSSIDWNLKGNRNDLITPGNFAGGVSSIIEKALGGMHKSGTSPFVDVLDYSIPPKDGKKGLFLMKYEAHDGEVVTGMAGCGAQIVAFTSGRGSPAGFPLAPVIKVTGNDRSFQRMRDNFDFDASPVILKGETIDQVGQELYDMILRVANGEQTAAEKIGADELFCVGRRKGYRGYHPEEKAPCEE